MVWQIVNKVDTENSRKIPLWARSPFVEMEGLIANDQKEDLKANFFREQYFQNN